jgi:pyruvate/2-oxoglutarate/acetoin dehydrogenase E1 component
MTRWRTYQTWAIIDEVERVVQEMKASGLLRGIYNESTSRAPVALALARLLQGADSLWLDHRNLAFFVANGVNLMDLLAELMGKDNDIARGWAGPLHWSAPWARISATNGIVGAPLGLAAGAALAQKYRKNGSLAVAVVGDQAADTGIFYETLDLAVRWRLPLCIIVVDNRRHPLPLAALADSRDWGYREVGDGDFDELESLVAEALAHVRRSQPTLVQVILTPSRTLEALEEKLCAQDPERVKGLREQAATWVSEALAKARQQPWAPDPQHMNTPVFGQRKIAKKRQQASLTISEALRQALEDAMNADPDIVVMGEDVKAPPALVQDPVWGGYFSVAHGLADVYRGRVFEAPVSEAAWIAAAVGLSLHGIQPVINAMNMSFVAMGFDAILNQAGGWPWITAGRRTAGLVLRAVVGAGVEAGFQHSTLLPVLFSQVPGIKVVLPSTPQDAYSLFIEAIQDPGPVVILEHVLLYRERGMVHCDQRVALGQARLVKPGQRVTVVTYGAMVNAVYEAQKRFPEDVVAIIDLRSLEPLDLATIVASLRETRRLMVVDEAPLRASVAPQVVARVMAREPGLVMAPPMMVTAPDTLVPYAASAERAYLPQPKRIAEALAQLLRA